MPVTAEHIAIAANRLIKHARTFSIPNVDAAAITDAYRLMCQTMPPDLLDQGLTEVLAGWKWGNRLPMPGEIWDAVKPEYDRRRRDLGRLETAQKFGRHDEPVAVEQRMSAEKLDAFMESVRRNLKRVDGPVPKGVTV